MTGSLEFRCITCGEVLRNETRTETCELCGQVEETEWICPNGHYFCTACRLAQPEEVVARVCLSTVLKDPFSIAETIMRHPHFQSHGPEFHYIVAPVLIAAACSCGFPADRSSCIAKAIERSRCIPSMACGSIGGCGAALGAGTALSVLTGADHMKGMERAAVLEASGRSLLALSSFGTPRCCRQAVYSSLEMGIEILPKRLDIRLEAGDHLCVSSGRVPGCHGEECRYHAR